MRLGRYLAALALVVVAAGTAMPQADPLPVVSTNGEALPGIDRSGRITRFSSLTRARYRAGLRAGLLQPGLLFASPYDAAKPTVIFVHGCTGSPSQFSALADNLREYANLAAFVYDDSDRLAHSAAELHRALLEAPGSVVVVAHSMGALLLAYAGATDPSAQLCEVSAVYLNPLIGGSHYADDIPALWWLRPLKPFIQRTFFPPSVQDLAPESDFQQTIFGPKSAVSCFAEQTVLLFSERAGEEPDVLEDRVPRFFGRDRDELLTRLGKTVVVPPDEQDGHTAPLRLPRLSLPVIEAAIHRSEMQKKGRAAVRAQEEYEKAAQDVREGGPTAAAFYLGTRSVRPALRRGPRVK